jgi:hypothetical protein
MLDSFIWHGHNYDKMHYSTMRGYYQYIIKLVGKDMHKSTHMPRIFSAEMLYELGISIADISAAGDWMLNHLCRTYIVPSLSPATLLAANGWTHMNGFDSFYAPRFDAHVPDELIINLFPDLPRLREKVKNEPSRKLQNFVKFVEFGAVVLIQDAFEEALELPQSPVYNFLLQNALFK